MPAQLGRTGTRVGISRTKSAVKRGRTRQKLRAYRNNNKRRMVARRAPMVETKSRTGEELALKVADSSIINNPTQFLDIPNDDAVTIFPLHSYNWMSQGLGEDEMIGLSVFSKWIKQKIQILLPSGQNAINFPCNLYIIHGWIKSPFGRTGYTNPTAPSATYAQFNTDVMNQLRDFFDNKEDKLRFIPKQNNQVKILGYKKVRPNRNQSISPPTQVFGTSIVPAGFKTEGSIPIINMSCTWKTMRKTYYTPGPTLTPHTSYFYNNSGWRPFVCLYNPEYAKWTEFSNTGPIKVALNDCHWYSDS